MFQIQDVELKRNPFHLGKRENIDIAACFENVEMTTQKGDLLFCFSFVKNYDRELTDIWKSDIKLSEVKLFSNTTRLCQ